MSLTRAGRDARPARRICAAALSASALAAANCGPGRAVAPRPAPILVEAWAARLPLTHEPLSAVLLGLGGIGGRAKLGPAGAELIRDYLAALAVDGPRTRPDRFPLEPQAIAYYVNAHVAWTIALGDTRRLAGLDADALRSVAFPLDGRETTLATIADEIARRAPWEPRLALFLNPGWRGGPPLPTCAVESHSLDWQLALQAESCGSAAGFWALDRAARRLSVSAFTAGMWGLPDVQPARTRRLLDLVPPPRDLREAILAACGASLQRCSVATAEFDTSRLFGAR